jgi:hypothetical protein
MADTFLVGLYLFRQAFIIWLPQLLDPDQTLTLSAILQDIPRLTQA